MVVLTPQGSDFTIAGRIEPSALTTAPPSRMENRGLPSSMLAPGNKATVVGYPSRNDPNEMRAERITIAGKTVELR